jgi:hypothetical protein
MVPTTFTLLFVYTWDELNKWDAINDDPTTFTLLLVYTRKLWSLHVIAFLQEEV